MNFLSKKNIIIFTVGLLVCLLHYSFFVKKAYIEVQVEVEQETILKIYWAEPGRHFSEDNMSQVTVYPGIFKYGMFLTDISGVERLRIDPHQYAGKATLRKIRIFQQGFTPIVLTSSSGLHSLQPLHQVNEFIVNDSGLHIMSTGDDPNFEYFLNLQVGQINWLTRSAEVIFIFMVSTLFLWACSPLILNLRFVPLMLMGVLVVILAMAILSKRNVHPDEYVHLTAVDYYIDHWFPPAIEDEAIRNSYSPYGVSRLNSTEIYYLLAGKFEKMISSYKIKEYLAERLFNVALLGFILVYCIKNRTARFVAIPLLISPQIWYVFSYCNSDGFAVFISFIVGCELVCPHSAFNRFIQEKRCQRIVFSALYLGLLFGAMLLLKKNYHPLLCFVSVWAVLKIVRTESGKERKELLLRLISIACIGLFVFTCRVGADFYVNGFDKGTKLITAQDAFADEHFKLGASPEERVHTLLMREQGITVESMIYDLQWFEKTFRSGFGLYGYFSIAGPNGYYDLVRWCAGFLACFFFLSLFIWGGTDNVFLATTAILLSAILVLASFYLSWTADFQPQGRYLFVILSMIGILCGLARHALNRTVLCLGTFAMYSLSMYSFICYALLRIPKIALL